MISVQNRLLLSNGNKKCFSLLVILFLTFFNSNSLFAQKDDDDDENTEMESYKGVRTTIEKETEVDSTYFSNGGIDAVTYNYKPLYNIAFILPINTEKISVGDGKNYMTKMPMSTREVLGFWEGANLAMDSIKRMRSVFHLHIWDNKNNDSVTAEILSELSSNDIDIVVSPFHTKQAIMVNEYCKKNNIPFFLPQNSSDAAVKDNPNSYKLVESKTRFFQTYYNNIINDISHKNNKILLIYNDSSKNERKLKNYLKYIDEKSGVQRMNFLAYSEINFLPAMLDSQNMNDVLVTMSSDKLVNSLLDAFGKLKSNYPINLYGNKVWLSNKKLDVKKLALYNTSVYSDFYLNNDKAKLARLKANYDKMTQDNVVTDVFKGYDATLYITNLINLYGTDFPQLIDKYKYLGVTSNIHLVPRYNNDGKLMFYENNAKFLMKATPTGWEKVTY